MFAPAEPRISEEAYERAAGFFRAAGDIARLKLLVRPSAGEWCVGGAGPGRARSVAPTVSQQLRLLRAEGSSRVAVWASTCTTRSPTRTSATFCAARSSTPSKTRPRPTKTRRRPSRRARRALSRSPAWLPSIARSMQRRRRRDPSVFHAPTTRTPCARPPRGEHRHERCIVGIGGRAPDRRSEAARGRPSRRRARPAVRHPRGGRRRSQGDRRDRRSRPRRSTS